MIFFEEPCYQVHVEDIQTQNVCVFFIWPVIIGSYMNWRWVTDDDPLGRLRRLELEKQIRKFLGQFYPCFFRKLVIWRHEHVLWHFVCSLWVHIIFVIHYLITKIYDICLHLYINISICTYIPKDWLFFLSDVLGTSWKWSEYFDANLLTFFCWWRFSEDH